MPLLTATFDPDAAAVVLVVDGSVWTTVPATITIVRRVAGEADIPVRGVDSHPVVGGYFAGSDHEMTTLGGPVTYLLSGQGTSETASVTVSTDGAAAGLWVKVPGQPDRTCRVRLRAVSEIESPTIGGVYVIAGGGGSVVQTTAQWSGVDSDRATVDVSVVNDGELASLRAALSAGRVLLLQPVGSTDLDPGWYFVSTTKRWNPGRVEAYPRRWVSLDVQRVGMPAGDGQGVPGASYAALSEAFATYGDMIASGKTYFDLSQGSF